MTSAALSPAAGEESWKGRSPELEDPLNRYLYHPLARRLARLLQPTPVTPNAVSAMSGAMVCAAAAFYSFGSWPVGVLAGFACHLTWHVFDGADGDLARLTGKASPIGEFVDGACDYLSHIVLYVALHMIWDGHRRVVVDLGGTAEYNASSPVAGLPGSPLATEGAPGFR